MTKNHGFLFLISDQVHYTTFLYHVSKTLRLLKLIRMLHNIPSLSSINQINNTKVFI